MPTSPAGVESEAPASHWPNGPEELARSAARVVVGAARQAVEQRGRFTLALSGGETPRALYQQLAGASQVDWSRVEFFWGDERPVPPEHPESNYRMAREALLHPLRVDPSRVHRIAAERDDLDCVALEYEAVLARVAADSRQGEPPQLDLVLLGLGADGHTASLYPYTGALSESRRWVVVNDVPQLSTHRVTITFPLIARARSVLVLVSGESKAAVLADVLEGPWDPERLPAQRLRPRPGGPIWMADAAAASRMRTGKGEAP